MQRWTRTGVLSSADDALRVAGVPAVLLLDAGRRPLVELLVHRSAAAAAVAALDGLPWRWRYGGEGRRPGPCPRAWTFDGGVVLMLRHSLPSAPWWAGAMRPLTRRLLAGAVRPGVQPAPVALQAVRSAAEAARTRLRHPLLLEELAQLLTYPATGHWQVLARRVGLSAPVARAVAAVQGSGQPEQARLTEVIAGRADAVMRRVLPGSMDARRRGAALEASVVRCRFGGVELLAGRGVFLPRGVSEHLLDAVESALEHRPRDAVVVDVGTGCGAVPLALARRRPGTVVVGTELDASAAAWARRNADRLGVPLSVHVGSLLQPLTGQLAGTVDVVCGNVPCVLPSQFAPAGDAAAAAYVGRDDDGLGLHRELATTARDILTPGGALVLQVQPAQWDALGPELVRLGYRIAGCTGDSVGVVGSAVWP